MRHVPDQMLQLAGSVLDFQSHVFHFRHQQLLRQKEHRDLLSLVLDELQQGNKGDGNKNFQ
jgi:hypothetical protein